MERRDDNDLGAVAMPGFIDILSTVIIMFVFFVTVIAIMLYVHTVKFKAEVLAQSQEKISEQVKDLAKKLEEGKISPEELKQLSNIAEDMKQIKSQFAESDPNQETEELVSDRVFIVFFDKNAITTAEDVPVKIKEFLAKVAPPESWSKLVIQIDAGTNPSAPTVGTAREMSLARMLNVRNDLLKLQIPQSQIGVSYSQEMMEGDNPNWVRIRVK